MNILDGNASMPQIVVLELFQYCMQVVRISLKCLDLPFLDEIACAFCSCVEEPEINFGEMLTICQIDCYRDNFIAGGSCYHYLHNSSIPSILV